MQVFHVPHRHRSGSRKRRRQRIIDIPKSGRSGDGVYAMRGKTLYRRRYVVPRNPRTIAQRQARDAFKNAAKAWGMKLTETQRWAWELVGMQEMSKPRLWQAGELLGEQVFTARNSVLLRVGKEILLWPTPRPVFKANPVSELSVTNGRDGVRIKLRASGPVEEDIMVFGQAPCSAGRKKWRRGAYLCLLPAPVGGEVDITAQYVARFGEPEPGTKVFIRTQQQRDGWKHMEKDLSEVVPVRAGKGECRVRSAECRIGATDQAQAASVGLDGLTGLHQSRKLHEVNGLSGSDRRQQDGAAGARAEGMGVRCTRGWFRVATASIPSHYRWGTPERWHIANGKWQNEGVGGRHSRRHWRELWRGS
jgi:hypothetical protein